MGKRAVTPPGAEEAVRPGMSQACTADGVVYVSGQVSSAGDLATQVAEAWSGVVELVEAAGGTAADVMELTVFVCGESPDPARSVLSAAWAALRPLVAADVGLPAPAVSVVQVVALARAAMQVEIKAIAHVAAGRD